MRRVYLSDQPAPTNMPFWLAVGILGLSAATLFRVNVRRQPAVRSLEFVLAAVLVLVGVTNWYSPDPARLLWVLPMLAACYWMLCIAKARFAAMSTIAIQGVAMTQLEFVGQTAIVFGWSTIATLGIVGFAEYPRWARSEGA